MHQNNGVGIIKSQKAFANMRNLLGKPEGKKPRRERNSTITMVIISGFLWCVRVLKFNW